MSTKCAVRGHLGGRFNIISGRRGCRLNFRRRQLAGHGGGQPPGAPPNKHCGGHLVAKPNQSRHRKAQPRTKETNLLPTRNYAAPASAHPVRQPAPASLRLRFSPCSIQLCGLSCGHIANNSPQLRPSTPPEHSQPFELPLGPRAAGIRPRPHRGILSPSKHSRASVCASCQHHVSWTGRSTHTWLSYCAGDAETPARHSQAPSRAPEQQWRPPSSSGQVETHREQPLNSPMTPPRY